MEFSAFHDHAQGCSCPGCWLHGVSSVSMLTSLKQFASCVNSAGCTVCVLFHSALSFVRKMRRLLPACVSCFASELSKQNVSCIDSAGCKHKFIQHIVELCLQDALTPSACVCRFGIRFWISILFTVPVYAGLHSVLKSMLCLALLPWALAARRV